MSKKTKAVIVSFSIVFGLQAQQKNDSIYQIKGVFNLLSKKQTASQIPPKSIFSFMPVIAANPVVGVSFGLALNESFCLGDFRDTKYSSITFTPVYTTKKQYSFGINNTIFSSKNQWRFSGGMNYVYFPQATSGLGSRTPQSWTHLVAPTTFKITQTASYQVVKNLYIGLGISFANQKITEDGTQTIVDRIQSLKDNGATTYQDFQNGLVQSADFGLKVFDQTIINPELLNNFDPNMSAASIQDQYFRTPMQHYNKKRNISNKYNVLGFQGEITFDSRDNINQAEKGTYINLLYSFYPKIDKGMGDKGYGILSLDLRKYIQLGTKKRSFLNLWSWSSLAHGDTPYLLLPATGADPTAKSTMAYKSGGYRSDFIFTAQIEYRYYFFKFFSAGVFASVNTLRETADFSPYLNEGIPVGNTNYIERNRDWQFKNWNPSVGPIVSVFLDKNSRTTMNFAYALGVKNDPGKYWDVANKGFYMFMSATF